MKLVYILIASLIGLMSAGFSQNIFDPDYWNDNYELQNNNGVYKCGEHLFTPINWGDPSKKYSSSFTKVSDLDGNYIRDIVHDFSDLPQTEFQVFNALVFEIQDTIYFCYGSSTANNDSIANPETQGLVVFFRHDQDLNLIDRIDVVLPDYPSIHVLSSREEDTMTLLFPRWTAHWWKLDEYHEVIVKPGFISEARSLRSPEYNPIPFLPEYYERPEARQIYKYKGRTFLVGNQEICEIDQDHNLLNFNTINHLINYNEIPFEYNFGRITIINDTIIMLGYYEDTKVPHPFHEFVAYLRFDLDLNLIDYGDLTSNINTLEYRNLETIFREPSVVDDKLAFMVNTKSRGFDFIPNELIIYIVNLNTLEIEHIIIYSTSVEYMYQANKDSEALTLDSIFIFPATFSKRFLGRHTSIILRVDTNGNLLLNTTSTEQLPGVFVTIDVLGNPSSSGYLHVRTTGVVGMAQFDMYHMNGKTVLRSFIGDRMPVQADLSHLPAGVYPFRIMKDGVVVSSSKWVKR